MGQCTYMYIRIRTCIHMYVCVGHALGMLRAGLGMLSLMGMGVARL